MANVHLIANTHHLAYARLKPTAVLERCDPRG